MRKIALFAAGLAAMGPLLDSVRGSSLGFHDGAPRPRRRTIRLPAVAPNDEGQVIDSTKESKRARRRRIARGG